MKRILVLGAGTGGVVTARELSKNSGNEEGINLLEIIVFEKEEKSLYSPSLPWLMVGSRKPNQIYENIRKLDAPGLKVIKGEIEKIDPENISVTVNGEVYKGDYMVVSLGVEQVYEQPLAAYGHNFFTVKGATKFNENLEKFDGGKIAILISSLPFKSPAAPYEAAMLIDDFIARSGLSSKTEISLFTPEGGPMEFAGKELSDELKGLLEQKGIKYYPNHQFISVSENTLVFSNGEKYEFDLLAYTPKQQSPVAIQNSALAGESGWVNVDRNTMETAFPDVYAIGDITDVPLEIGVSLPKIGFFAKQQGAVVAHNIGRKIAGKDPDKSFNGEGQFFIEYGKGKASATEGNFYTSPTPEVKMKTPEHLSHWSKWWSEKYWFFKNF
ncbi:NAD(P)/FAD-dependent oxidoreductase [Pontibacter anaerobius]|uniref:FAD-dependent oxidoreductase n=1 Tax=Pontibacter anaerobius TaxID=2993940 RepID=A0ABT3RHZ5_9BACT|nr:FAD-dependent oxidoreductase [Pontibacter anaerobius]MCX2741446.1 FAD-dependent oxidoreductase [Pontibacter anaerobius]